MKMLQVLSIITISLFSLGLAAPVSNADEIEDLKKTLSVKSNIQSKIYNFSWQNT